VFYFFHLIEKHIEEKKRYYRIDSDCETRSSFKERRRVYCIWREILTQPVFFH